MSRIVQRISTATLIMSFKSASGVIIQRKKIAEEAIKVYDKVLNRKLGIKCRSHY
jgi:hypothetical protein